MQSLVDDLLQLTKINQMTEQYTFVDLRELILSVKNDLRPLLLSTDGTIQISSTLTVKCNRSSVYQILINLIENALKFHKPDTPPIVQVETKLINGDFFEICVGDNGIGFEEQDFESSLVTFERLGGVSDYEGVGIGLGIVKKIVDKLHGTIFATSQIGKGSVFSVKLPLSQ